MKSQNKKFCPISGKEKNQSDTVHPEVKKFAGFYRDKLNVEQKIKVAHLMRSGARLDTKNKPYITVQACLSMFYSMKKYGHSWEVIQNNLKKELLDKNLITEKEFVE